MHKYGPNASAYFILTFSPELASDNKNGVKDSYRVRCTSRDLGAFRCFSTGKIFKILVAISEDSFFFIK